MTVSELLQSVQFVVDPEGTKSAVILSMDVWEQVLTLLEDMEDAEEIRQARKIKDDTIPWDQAKKQLGLEE
jgi:hypothetical protein